MPHPAFFHQDLIRYDRQSNQQAAFDVCERVDFAGGGSAGEDNTGVFGAPRPGEQVGTTGLVACPDILDDLIPGVLHFLTLMGEMFFKHNAGVI